MDAKVKAPTSSSSSMGFGRGFREAQEKKTATTLASTPDAAKKKKSTWPGWGGLFRRNKPAKKSTSSDDSGDEHRLSKALIQPVRLLQPPPKPLPKDRYSPGSVGDSLSPPPSELSSSTASLSRKERREAILARAQARRRDGDAGGSSSDEQETSTGPRNGPSPSPGQQRHPRRSHHNSQESLTSSNGKSRSSRTERYLQRRSRDEESFRSQSLVSVSNPASPSKCWPPVSSPTGSWGVVTGHPEPTVNPRLAMGESPVLLRSNGPGSYYNQSLSPAGRTQSALITHGKLTVHPVHPPPPPPRNPLKKSYLLQANDPALGQQQQQQQHNPCRPTSFSFGEFRLNVPQQQQQPPQQQERLQFSLHDYQNVDPEGRIILVDTRVSNPTVQSVQSTCLTSPVQRRMLNGSASPFYSPQSRHHSAFYPAVAIKSPSPFLQQQQQPEQQERPKPPWLAKSINSPVSPTAPVREFWRSKDTQAAQPQHPVAAPPPPTPPKPTARERLGLSPLNSPGTNGSVVVASPHSNLPSPKGAVIVATATSSPSGGACRPFVPPAGSTPVTPKGNQNKDQHPVRELSQLRPSTDRHLEQAICELEDIYRSLKLDGDEDLLDRAERRDLPTAHQQLLNRSSIYSGSESGGDPLHGPGITSDLDTMMNWSISGSFESLNTTGTTVGSGSGRVRAPPRRRSAVPDKVADDMALRRLQAARKSETKEYESGSYLLVTPSMAAADELNGSSNSRSGGSGSSSEPDIVLDDLAVRQVRAASLALKKVADPQPPFGIPNVLLSPVSPAPPTDYLHVNVKPEQKALRPLLHPTKYPDLVRDDLAYRQLRKDAGHSYLVNTDKLDELLRENNHPNNNSAQSFRQKRAVRSLSANIGQLIIRDASRPSGGGGVVDPNRNDEDSEDERYIDPNPFDVRAQSLTDLLSDDVTSYSALAGFNNNNYCKPAAKTPRSVKQRSGLKRVTKSCEVEHPELVTITRQVRPEPSWVERAQLSSSGTPVTTAEVSKVPGLAKLYPKTALLPVGTDNNNEGGSSSSTKLSAAADEMDHLISDLSEFAASSGTSSWKSNKAEVDSTVSSGGQLAGACRRDKPPTGPLGAAAASPEVLLPCEADGHDWEESPLFQSQPQFNFRSASPANSTDSGQVSCCAREVRQILQHQQQGSRSSSGRKTSRPDQQQAADASLADSSSLDRSVPQKGRTQPLPADRSTTTTTRRMSNNNETGSPAAAVQQSTAMEKRAERIARYKEERRKQLQSSRQPGSSRPELSSSSEDLLAEDQEQSYAKYKHRKQMQKQLNETETAAGRTEDALSSAVGSPSDAANSNVLGKPAGIKRFIKRESPSEDSTASSAAQPVRTNRAARLRAAATSATPPPPSETAGQPARIKRSSTAEIPTAAAGTEISADPLSEAADSITLRQKAGNGRPEKDKSTKRKSNLNRALTDEQIVNTPSAQNESQEDDGGKRIRRRRIGDPSGASPSSADTDMSSSVDSSLAGTRRPVSESPVAAPAAADLRAGLRKTSHPPAFIRPNDSKEKSPSPSLSVPWRTAKLTSNGNSPANTTSKKEPAIKTEDLTARIEALTAIASQTVAKVERITGESTNGTHPATPGGGGGNVKAVASKLLNRVAESPPKQPGGLLPSSLRPGRLDAAVNPPAKLSPPQLERIPPPSPAKNKSSDKPLAGELKLASTATGQIKPPADEAAPSAAPQPLEKGVETANSGNGAVASSVKAVQGILKKKVEGSSDPVPHPTVRIRPVEVDKGEEAGGEPPVSILKRRSSREEVEAEGAIQPESPATSILKRPPSRDGSAESSRSISPDPLNSILRRPPSATGQAAPSNPPADPSPASTSEPRPILKKRSSTEDCLSDPRPILKKKSSTDDEHEPSPSDGKPKPILKSGGRRFSSEHLDAVPPRRPVELQRAVAAPEGTEEQPTVESSQTEDAESRPLSVAERIEAHKQNAAAAASANPPPVPAPRRLLPRINGGSESAGVVAKRRKSLEVINNQAAPGGALVEAVNRHVAAPNGGEPSPANAAQAEDFDPSKLSLAERMRLFERTSVPCTPPHPPPRALRPRKAALPRSQTQPVTTQEVNLARHLRQKNSSSNSSNSSSSIQSSPAIEVVPPVGSAPETPESNEEAEASGLDRIRGILRRKSSESALEMKGILRSKSPSGDGLPPKSILKRHNPEEEEDEEQGGSSSTSSGSEDVVVPAENDLAAKLLNVEMEAKISQAAAIQEPETPAAGLSKAAQQSTATSTRRETETILVESEESGSGTETTTTVTFRLGATGSTATMVQQSQKTTKSSSKTTTTTQGKVAVMEELTGTSSLAARRKRGKEVGGVSKEVDEDEEEEDGSSSGAEVQTTVSLRLAALQKSGENDWRKRVPSTSSTAALEAEEAGQASDNDIPTTKSKIADRLKVLETAQLGWKMRVGEQDAARFTVAGKMGQRPVSAHILTTDSPASPQAMSPVLDRKKKANPKPLPLRMIKDNNKTTQSEASDSSASGTPSTDEANKPNFSRSTSEPNGVPDPDRKKGKVSSRIVSVPRPDDETFTSFFAASSSTLLMDTMGISSSSSATSFSLHVTAEDFDHITISRNLIVEKRSVHVQRRKNASRNPVKSLILRTDLCRDAYEEVDTGVAEREVQRIKLEQLAKGSHLAVEALAGLASKENFAAIALKSAKDAESSADGAQPKTYLLQIKGRRHVQTRLVDPVPSSINSGDCYVLVTPTDVIQWVGRYSNVIERAKCSEVAQRILLKKDLGSGKVKQAQLIEEEKVMGGSGILFGPSKRFWQALGRTESSPEVAPAGPPEEDELYEEAVVSTNTAWELSGDQLIPFEPSWGKLLQVDMLDPNKVVVFDFGSEMYVWSGKFAALEARRKAFELAEALWKTGYDYSECSINPIHQRATPPEESKSPTRPAWALLKSAKQHMEPVLFREKFVDWPDKTQLIKVKRQESDENRNGTNGVDGSGAPPSSPPAATSLIPCDAQAMLDNQLEDPDLELEGTHLGRGVEYYDQAERRLHKVSTLSVKVWHLMDYEKVALDEVSHGQFHARDTYVIRWQYRVTVTGKDLKGQPSVHGLLGRDRFCYFIWQGAQAPPTDLGASALTTVELDEERGPHVRLEQGSEPPAFLALFQGRMVVHRRKRGEPQDGTDWRLFCVRGEKAEEAHLLEIERGARALRSRGSLILINASTGTVYLWHGAKSLKHTRQVALVAATCLKDRRPPELGLKGDAITIKDQYEGAECRDFWQGLGHESRVADRSLYLSLAESKSRFDFTPRLFHLTSWSGQFRADEIPPLTRCPELPCPYPFLQEALYKANQPTLFMLDNGDEVWLWQGWWPDLPDTENTVTGSSKLRWAAERRCALETVLDYCRYKQESDDEDPPAAHLISAGLEPLAFTCLFPEWTVDDRVAQLNVQEGRTAGEIQSVREVLDRLKGATYTLKELQVRPLPEQMILEGVDPTRLESYLTPAEFQATLGMSKTDFYALPAWRQSQLRKETGLF